MRKFNFYVLLIFCLSGLLINVSFSQYWFQSGAQAYYNTDNNNGGSITIMTTSQNISLDSFGFWVGEHLQNNAFIQVGYTVYNETGYLKNNCTLSGCSSKILITKHVPFWFYEYFPASNLNSTNFYGSFGSDYLNLNSFNNFSFNFSSLTNKWNFYVNGHEVGSVNLYSSSSGNHVLYALAEYANASNNGQYMSPVEFKNFRFYKDNQWQYVSKAYSYISYGAGSETNILNNYGVQEYDSLINNFIAGSGLSLQNNVLLWNLGYKLNIVSQYNVINGSGNYSAYSMANIKANKTIYLNNTARAILMGYQGTGFGSYTGNDTNFSVQMNNNITEHAIWQLQYYVNVSSQYGTAAGTGWYNANSSANISLNANTLQINPKERVLFKSWNNNINAKNFSVLINSSKTFNAIWQLQYYVNVSSQYGTAAGTGWYNANSSANISLSNKYFYVNNRSRLLFYSWDINNKTTNANQTKINIIINSSKQISALFKTQYLVSLETENNYGNKINQSYFYINGNKTNNSMFLTGTPNKSYNISSVYFKNTSISTNYMFNLTEPKLIVLKLPVYNITIKSRTLFGTSVNATGQIQFYNKTNTSFYLGNNGTKTFVNVPYGYATGYINYFNLKYPINIANGGVADFVFVTPSLILIIVAGILIIIISYEIGKHYSRKMKDRKINEIINK